MILHKAKCSKGVVSIVYPNVAITPVPVYDCIHLGNELPTAADSTGIIIANEDRFYYIPLAIQNIRDIATKMLEVCSKLREVCDALSPASNLLDTGTQVVGQATMTLSTIEGTNISNTAKQIGQSVDQLKNDITEWSQKVI